MDEKQSGNEDEKHNNCEINTSKINNNEINASKNNKGDKKTSEWNNENASKQDKTWAKNKDNIKDNTYLNNPPVLRWIGENSFRKLNMKNSAPVNQVEIKVD